MRRPRRVRKLIVPYLITLNPPFSPDRTLSTRLSRPSREPRRSVLMSDNRTSDDQLHRSPHECRTRLVMRPHQLRGLCMAIPHWQLRNIVPQRPHRPHRRHECRTRLVRRPRRDSSDGSMQGAIEANVGRHSRLLPGELAYLPVAMRCETGCNVAQVPTRGQHGVAPPAAACFSASEPTARAYHTVNN
jgi:hypothetical protein